VKALDWAKLDATRDLTALRAHLAALEEQHGITEAHRVATAKVRALGARLTHAHGQPGELVAFALSPDAKHLATGAWCGSDYDRGGVLQVWDVALGRCVNTLDPVMGGVGWPDHGGCLQWTLDGARLGAAFNTNGVGAWDPFDKDAEPQSQAYVTNGQDEPPAWCWSPDGGRVFVSSWMSGEIPGFFVGLDATPRTGRFRAPRDPKPAPMAAKIAKGPRAALAGDELEARNVVRWSADGARVFGHASSQAYVTDNKGHVAWLCKVTAPVAWSADERSLVDATDGLTFRDGSTGQPLRTHPEHAGAEALFFAMRGAVSSARRWSSSTRCPRGRSRSIRARRRPFARCGSPSRASTSRPGERGGGVVSREAAYRDGRGVPVRAGGSHVTASMGRLCGSAGRGYGACRAARQRWNTPCVVFTVTTPRRERWGARHGRRRCRRGDPFHPPIESRKRLNP
jgi:hypothetical protein